MDQLENLEIKISKFLRAGVILSGSLLLIGWLMDFNYNHNPFAEFSQYSNLDLGTALEVAFMGEKWGILICYLGLFILISLPMIRVLLTAILFVKQKEMMLAGIAALVLFALILSFSLGIEL